MRFEFYLPAGTHERFAQGAFATSVGKPLIFEGQPATLVDAEVVDDGAAVLLTVEVDGYVGLVAR